MKQITLTLPDGKAIRTSPYAAPLDIITEFGIPPQEIFGMKVNNDAVPLSDPFLINAHIEPIRKGSRGASAIYRRSLCFVLAAAAYNLFPHRRLQIGHSLGYAYYYTFADGQIPDTQTAGALKSEMMRLIGQDAEIETEILSFRDTAERLEQMGLVETRKQLDYMGKPAFKINTLAGFSDLYFEPLVPRTGYLDLFDLHPYGEGFLLCYPSTIDPNILPPPADIPKLFSVYRYYKQWGKKLEVTSAASLNELIYQRKIDDFINISETLQDKRIADIAETIRRRGNVKIVLMAGPSSSGKTTSSKKLALQLKALGYRPQIIELDSYYVERSDTPKDKDGNYDYECLEALDIALLNSDLIDLFKGKEVQIPSYNFTEGKRYYSGKCIKLNNENILIMEGIHGLNDSLTPLVPAEYKFKIYLSALTQLNMDDLNRISTRDNRLVRRIVRDASFRGKTAAQTIAMWDSVGKGERLHIFPFQNNADVMLNTALDYELSVLKVYAEPLLRRVSPLQKEYSEASRLLRFLQYFSSIPAAAVPPHSIIREFIGDSAFKY